MGWDSFPTIHCKGVYNKCKLSLTQFTQSTKLMLLNNKTLYKNVVD